LASEGKKPSGARWETVLSHLDNFINFYKELWDTALPPLKLRNGFVSSLFLLVGVETTVLLDSQILRDGFSFDSMLSTAAKVSALEGVQFGVILAVSVSLSMTLSARILRYELDNLPNILGYGTGCLLLSVLSLPIVAITPHYSPYYWSRSW